MLNSVPVQEQYEQAGGDGLRILVAGAGMAGVTVAQLLRRQGLHPVLIERRRDEGHPGYMLALMPMVDQALNDLGVREHYRIKSVPLARYGFHAHTGRLLRDDSMSSILDRYGDYRGISRGKLIDTLASQGCDVAYGATVTGIKDTPFGVEAALSEGRETHTLEFDVVIVAEGIRSSTRDLLVDSRKVEAVDTGWGGWVVWADADAEPDLGDELWGAAFFLGVYPVQGKLGVFLGGPAKDTAVGAKEFVARVRSKLTTVSARTDRVLNAVAEDPEPYYWPLKDCRANQWAFGRTVLLGDAAAGFLPTAGIGAGMAIESAWALARILRYANHGNVAALLRAYEEAQRPRVEAAQNTSRQLARFMFRHSRLIAALRDTAMRLASVEMAIKPIQRLLAVKADPDATARAALANPATEPARR